MREMEGILRMTSLQIEEMKEEKVVVVVEEEEKEEEDIPFLLRASLVVRDLREAVDEIFESHHGILEGRTELLPLLGSEAAEVQSLELI